MCMQAICVLSFEALLGMLSGLYFIMTCFMHTVARVSYDAEVQDFQMPHIVIVCK